MNLTCSQGVHWCPSVKRHAPVILFSCLCGLLISMYVFVLTAVWVRWNQEVMPLKQSSGHTQRWSFHNSICIICITFLMIIIKVIAIKLGMQFCCDEVYLVDAAASLPNLSDTVRNKLLFFSSYSNKNPVYLTFAPKALLLSKSIHIHSSKLQQKTV